MTSLLICGSREATPRMLTVARRSVERARDLNWSVIVGEAAGVDRAVIFACHELAVPFVMYGIAAEPRNFCCLPHVTANYRQVKGSYLTRDREMAATADRCFGIWNGTSRGTIYTCNYARKQGKVVDLWQPSQMPVQNG